MRSQICTDILLMSHAELSLFLLFHLLTLFLPLSQSKWILSTFLFTAEWLRRKWEEWRSITWDASMHRHVLHLQVVSPHNSCACCTRFASADIIWLLSWFSLFLPLVLRWYLHLYRVLWISLSLCPSVSLPLCTSRSLSTSISMFLSLCLSGPRPVSLCLSVVSLW